MLTHLSTHTITFSTKPISQSNPRLKVLPKIESHRRNHTLDRKEALNSGVKDGTGRFARVSKPWRPASNLGTNGKDSSRGCRDIEPTQAVSCKYEQANRVFRMTSMRHSRNLRDSSVKEPSGLHEAITRDRGGLKFLHQSIIPLVGEVQKKTCCRVVKTQACAMARQRIVSHVLATG